MCLSGWWSMQTGRAMEGPATAEEAEGVAEGLVEETIAAAVIMAMVATVVAIPAVVAAVIPATVVATLVAAAATLAAVLVVVVVETLVVAVAVEVPTGQVLLLPGTTRRTPWAPLTSAPLAGTSQCPRVSLMHIPYI